jgi:predicted Holliday junction resolvase-like endonuclease
MEMDLPLTDLFECPDDAKIIFHPIDYVVFDGMKKESIKNIILLDRQEKGTDHRALQRSIEKLGG